MLALRTRSRIAIGVVALFGTSCLISSATTPPRRGPHLTLIRFCKEIDYASSELSAWVEEEQSRRNPKAKVKGYSSQVGLFEADVASVQHLGLGKASITFSNIKKPEFFVSENKIAAPHQLVLAYDDSQSPQPFVPGSHVMLGIDRKGGIAYAIYREVDIRYWRKRPNGRYEVIAQLEGSRKSAGLVHLQPQFLGGVPNPTKMGDGGYTGHAVFWTKKFGVVITYVDIGCGGGEYEQEMLRHQGSGVPVGNEPGFRFKPGREGWNGVEQTGIENEQIPDEQYIEFDANVC